MSVYRESRQADRTLCRSQERGTKNCLYHALHFQAMPWRQRQEHAPAIMSCRDFEATDAFPRAGTVVIRCENRGVIGLAFDEGFRTVESARSDPNCACVQTVTESDLLDFFLSFCFLFQNSNHFNPPRSSRLVAGKHRASTCSSISCNPKYAIL